jgi:hypothetical protein
MTRRKPPERENGRTQLPLPGVRKQVWAQACDLVSTGTGADIPSLLARRFDTTEEIINRILIAEGMKHEREAAALRSGLLSALSLGREARASVDGDSDFRSQAKTA